jgi:hypothetical protein
VGGVYVCVKEETEMEIHFNELAHTTMASPESAK